MALICCLPSVEAQKERIVALLNNQFVREGFMYKSMDPDQPYIHRPFMFVDDTLKVSTFYYLDLDGTERAYFERSVCLCDLEGITTAYGFLFRAKPASVTQTYYQIGMDGAVRELKIERTTFFDTALRKDINGYPKFKKKLTKAFDKAGYAITS
jgi:hypothetical protein